MMQSVDVQTLWDLDRLWELILRYGESIYDHDFEASRGASNVIFRELEKLYRVAGVETAKRKAWDPVI